MTEFVRELFANGKVTIPRELRKLYHLKDGDLVTLKIVEIIRGGEAPAFSTRTTPSTVSPPAPADDSPEAVQ